MRLKLVFIASILSAIIGAGSSIGTTLAFSSSVRPPTPGLLAALALLIPIVTVLLAAIFVYRHTARRRRLQAIITALLSILLSLAIFVAAAILTAQPQPLQPPDHPLPENVGKLGR